MVPQRQTEFSKILKDLMDKSGKTRYRLARCSGVDEAYIFRLESGERRNPTRDIVVKLGLGLMHDSSSVTVDDVNELLLSAEHSPLRGRGEQLPPLC